MMARLKTMVLRGLRVPPEPTPPAGAPGSLRVFRAGRNYWTLCWVLWLGKQLSAAFGILVSVAFIQEIDWQRAAAQTRAEHRERFAAKNDELAVEVEPLLLPERTGLARLNERLAPRFFFNIAQRVPQKLVIWLKGGEALAIVGFVLQLPFTFLVARLDYSYRWYLVTDRSLRLRHGLFTVHEATMSFANLQQVEIKQGPLQRLLGLSDLRVRSAGGGDGGSESRQDGDATHDTLFHAVDNAPEIRDLILARLGRYRAAGLGDPDDPEPAPPSNAATVDLSEAVAAARELAGEARKLRAALTATR
jgi:hypothetical protein